MIEAPLIKDESNLVSFVMFFNCNSLCTSRWCHFTLTSKAFSHVEVKKGSCALDPFIVFKHSKPIENTPPSNSKYPLLYCLTLCKDQEQYMSIYNTGQWQLLTPETHKD